MEKFIKQYTNYLHIDLTQVTQNPNFLNKHS